jgi:ubiquinone/menaquinone biosynthesis C-methylase UbiE
MPGATASDFRGYTEAMAVENSTERFSSRVADYVRSRPGYPREVLQLLKNDCALGADSVVADVASGTGIFTQLLLETGCEVYGVEPNAAMREEGEEFLRQYPRFVSVNGTAEATTLADHSVGTVTAAQAAHWFDPALARQEFIRILKPSGWCVLLWNERVIDSSPFLTQYEQLLNQYGTDYNDVRHEHTTKKLEQFFAGKSFREQVFPNHQEFDYQGLEGRVLSSSYMPQEGHANYEPMLKNLRQIFESTQTKGRVTMPYNTRVFYRQLT